MKDLRRLLGYIWPLRSRVVLIVVLSAVVAQLSVISVGAAGPVFSALFEEEPSAQLIDLGQQGFFAGISHTVNAWALPLLQWARANMVVAVGVIMAFLAVVTFVKGTAAFFQEFLTGMLATRVGVNMANELYDHSLHLSLANYTRQGIADPVTRFTVDIDAIVLGLATLFGKAIREPITFITFFVLLVSISPRLTLAVFVIVPLLTVIAAVIGKQVKRAMSNVLSVRSRLVQQLQETFRGIRIVKAFVTEPREVERFGALNERLYRQTRRIHAGRAAMSPLLELMGVLAAAVVLVFAAQLVVGAQLEPGHFLAYAGGLFFMMGSVRKLSNVYNRIQIMLAAAERIFELRDQVPAVQERPDARELPTFREAVRFEDVRFSYDEGEEVLRGVTLKASRGERIALVGVSGVGKTTLVNLVPRFYEPTAGRVTVDCIDLREVTLKSLRQQIGLVSQEVLLFDDTVAANIAYGSPGSSQADVVEAARKAHADEFIRELPRGYDSVLGEDAVTLSGGQRQRIALARAILRDPAILILDEPTSQLDSESEHHIQQALDEFVRGRTTFIIAHRLSTVEGADKIVVLEEGRVADLGTHVELLQRSPLYRKLYQLQFGG